MVVQGQHLMQGPMKIMIFLLQARKHILYDFGQVFIQNKKKLHLPVICRGKALLQFIQKLVGE